MIFVASFEIIMQPAVGNEPCKKNISIPHSTLEKNNNLTNI
jgi:hypothetical protein